MNLPTKEQIKELWEWCGFKYKEEYHYGNETPSRSFWRSPDNLIYIHLPQDLNNLFRYAVPMAVSKLEGRFDDMTNLVRGLELLFQKWLDKIGEGYSLEDALFWAIKEVKYE